MDHGHGPGIAVAAFALLLSGGVWLVDGWTAPAVADRDGFERASVTALEINGDGQPLTWRDSPTGVLATITPATIYRAGDGRWCRSYSVLLAAADDHPAASRGRFVACRDGAGRWSRAAGMGDQVAGN